MHRRRFLESLTAVSITVALAGCTETSLLGDEYETYENPVFEPTLADPSIIRYTEDDADEDVFYAYGTEDHWHGESNRHNTHGLQYVPIIRSTNLVDWEYVDEAFSSKPAWKSGGSLWAPDITEWDDEFYLYYSYSEWDDPNPGIGVATADHPTGPFEDQGKLFDSEGIDVENSIDPYFHVEDGTPYVFWGSWYGIWGVELSDDGLEVTGDPFRIADDNHFEAPYIIERDDYYYFFGSNGHCCNGEDSDYHVVVARSESLDGPYLNMNDDPIESNPGTRILEGNSEFVGPGHNAVIQDDAANDWILYHAYDVDNFWINDTPRRTLMIDRIYWEDGWPTVENESPNEEEKIPIIDEGAE